MQHLTFDKIVHDYGLLTYTNHQWNKVTDDEWTRIIQCAPQGWWKDVLKELQSIHAKKFRHPSSINDYVMFPKGDRLIEMLSIPKWLIEGPNNTSYLGIIPRDILGIIRHYLHTITILPYNRPGFISHTAPAHITYIHSFCGWKHTLDDSPSVIHYDVETVHRYCRWYHFGKKHRDNGLPAEITIGKSINGIAWYRNNVATYEYINHYQRDFENDRSYAPMTKEEYDIIVEPYMEELYAIFRKLGV